MKRKVNKTKKVAILTVGLVSLFSTAIPMVSNATTETRTAQGTYYDYLVVETEDGNEWLLDDSTKSKYLDSNGNAIFRSGESITVLFETMGTENITDDVILDVHSFE